MRQKLISCMCGHAPVGLITKCTPIKEQFPPHLPAVKVARVSVVPVPGAVRSCAEINPGLNKENMILQG